MKPLVIYSKGVRPLRSGKPSAKEYPHWDKLVELLSKDFIVIEVVQEPLDRLEALLKVADYVLACDSFLQHFCWSIGVKAHVLWGTSDPLIFGHAENVNILKDRKYVRPNQFDMWENDVPQPEAFVLPEEVMKYINQT
jgi:hypothetical protein